ncbi:MAG: hypothetical protein NWF07_09190 [Candidatus Bathyarchaeota archaeon]|nr:hypothetical protein [Candidatus Bathyarchaeota archaeon]
MNWAFIIFLLMASIVGLLAFMKGVKYPVHSYDQHETDIRLTFKRYKELYPNATITYQEYKDLQKKKAFKKSVSSRNLKRMVR